MMSHYEVLPGIIRVRGRAGPAGEAESAYVVLGEESVAIIDSGNPGSRDFHYKILRAVEDTPDYSLKDVKYLLITHEHWDHIGGLSFLKKQLKNAQLLVHEKAQETVENPRAMMQTKHFEVGRRKRLSLSVYDDPFRKLEKVKVDGVLGDDDKIDLGNTKLFIIHTGGHCVGHIFYLSSAQRALFVGDEVIYYPGDYNHYFIDLTGSASAREKALEFVLKLRMEALCPTHDEAFLGREAYATVRNALEAHKRREETILDVLSFKEETTLEEIGTEADALLGVSWAEPLQTFLDHTTTLAHLIKLEKEGKVSKIEKEKTPPKWFLTP